MTKLITTSNPKLQKSTKFGYYSFGLHLAPYKLGGKNICPNASKGCIAGCLNTSGHGYFGRTQEARVRRTNLFHTNKEQFFGTLIKNIETEIKRAERENLKPSMRLNLTSDIPWESVKWEGKTVMERFPQVQFFDYTKNVKRMLKFVTGTMPKNYHLTFSRTEKNWRHCQVVLACGGNVAVVFKKNLPKTWQKYKVVDGLKSDLRFLDPKGVIVGLKALGPARKDTSGFVINF